ncbi:endonuclease [Priestia aryabhattai]|uniref:GIY-YIG nuclease family protein n=1 Tax=Bacillaceae TaxID=186817 RepID=UPI000BA047A4|nr:GIY-YIG nuclease family protein [Bacillus sp. CBEL-1]OZT10918.1 endonuclease [Priestia aryabhattai]TDB47784.1 GIY-YIG nuclease family protein [Bacillus sp. CBEL-1]USY55199.1 GIY-YIG nuclease family protein [Bacillus sp. 1780r2a1]
MEQTKHYFYVLECKDQSYYAGYTNNLNKRLAVHNSGKGAKYTKSRLPVVLLWHEEYKTKTEAMRKEYWFKQLSRKQKEQYILKEQKKSHELTKKL